MLYFIMGLLNKYIFKRSNRKDSNKMTQFKYFVSMAYCLSHLLNKIKNTLWDHVLGKNTIYVLGIPGIITCLCDFLKNCLVGRLSLMISSRVGVVGMN
jgi:hypothetical protein